MSASGISTLGAARVASDEALEEDTETSENENSWDESGGLFGSKPKNEFSAVLEKLNDMRYQRLERSQVPVEDLMAQYLVDVDYHRLLTAEEEVHLSQTIERGVAAAEQLKDADEADRPMLIKMAEAGEEARSVMVRANVGLVISVARKYFGQGLDMLDLIQEGNMGLLRATEKYDYRLGNRFSTYATWWIRQSVSRALVNFGRAIRIPSHQATNVRRLYRAARELRQLKGDEPTMEEIADHVDMPAASVEWLMQITRPLLALEQPAGADKDAELSDFLEDKSAPEPAQEVESVMLREQVLALLDELTPKEASILRLRYGLQGMEPLTLREVGDRFGLSKERIRQLEKQALSKLRNMGLSHELALHLN